jgi:hypothetical protein
MNKKVEALRTALNGAMVSLVQKAPGKRDGIVILREGNATMPRRVTIWADAGQLRVAIDGEEVG